MSLSQSAQFCGMKVIPSSTPAKLVMHAVHALARENGVGLMKCARTLKAENSVYMRL